MFCNGDEFCDAELDCSSTGDPCDEGETCDEENDVCESGGEQIVSFDIKPGSCPNPFNTKAQGVLPAAILGTDDVDVKTIDPDTLMLTREGIMAGVPILRYSYEDVGKPFTGELCDCHDRKGDGYKDLTLKFSVQDLVAKLKLDKIEDRETIPLTIVGATYDGTPIRGEDCIWVINNKPKPKK
jgi:hypothetical protein